MELRQLRYFVGVAEDLNFNRAADRLLVAQPALSQQIRHLEEELGIKLFDRSRRQIQLTAAGKSLLLDARRLLAEAEIIARSAKKAERGEIGRLVVGFTPIASWLLPAFVRIYQKRFPDVEILFEELLNFEQTQMLSQQRIDIAFTLGNHAGDNLQQKLISSLASIIAVPARRDPTDLEKTPVRWQDLSEQPFIMFPHRIQPQLFDEFVSKCHAVGFRPNIKKEVAQIETILNLVSAGSGVAPVPEYLKAMVKWKGVVFKTLEQPSPRFEIFAVWRSEDKSPALRNFIALIEEQK